MGISVASSSRKNTRRRQRASSQLMSEINVTPFVDVMLVLLIIFMVSAPLLVNGVPLDLPHSQAGPVRMERTPLTVSLDAQGRFAINQDYYDTSEALIEKLKAQLITDPEQKNQRIFVRAAKTVEYQKVLQLLADIQKAGFLQVALASLAQ
ncbi:Biopolymer transport protein exbD [Candidatus Bartonella washoeensis]|uniref:Protein TolR n=2 Tax=Candidatus Bartonella washoeensis TaxID=186739 RepID=J0QN71_9HYPH|nr:protein TolR [Bartonella washoeensis]EJF79844.1 protein TolR [Bartonella washoeensis Sb944nv]EJF84429.1 protein TolR [Bartonella washoeensis 085-0475]SPU26905.1 Biopolymer transport protein exbD [Bartonella washoeensis]SPU26907.1 Biopolymer transport protein exbD [Bartonella washoeensis]